MDKKMMSIIAVLAVVAVVAVAAVALIGGWDNGGDTKYTLTYESNGGNEIADVQFTKNTETFSLTTPTKENAVFLGWYDNSALTGSTITKVVKGTEKNLTLYAKWQLNLTSIPAANEFSNNSEINVVFDESANSSQKVVPAELISAMSEGKTLTVENKVDGKTTLSWTFNGASATNDGYSSQPVSTSVAIDTTTHAAEKKIVLAFEYEGKLPYASTIRTFVGDQFPAGTQISVQNENDAQPLGVYTVDADGYIEFTIDHCSDWNLTYYVTFELLADGGVFENGKDVLVIGGVFGSVVDPADIELPYKAGYELILGYEWTEPIPEVYENSYHYTANWQAVQYRVIFHTNGGSTVLPAEFTVLTSVDSFATPTMAHCTFDGWYANEQLTGTPVTSVPVGHVGDIDLYAKWAPETYAISYNLNGGTNAASNPESYAYGSEVTFAPASRDYYTFDGWYDNELCTGPSVTSISSESYGVKSLYAKWVPVTYTLTFDTMGGTPAVDPVSFTVETPTFSLPVGAVTKAGFAFVAWYTGETYSSESEITQIALGTHDNITVKAQWGENNATLLVILDGAAYAVSDVSAKIGANSVAVRAGSTVGSYSVKTSADFPISEGASVEFYVGAVRVATATVTNGTARATAEYFNVNFYSDAQAVYATIPVLSGSNATAPVTDPERNGYDFSLWETSTHVAFDFETGVISETTYLYAKWTPVTYTVSYVLNDGTNDLRNPVEYTIADLTKPLYDATKEGYTFAGWYTNQEFTGDAVTEITHGSYGDLTLYAKYDLVSYTLTYNTQGGSSIAPQTFNAETATFNLSNDTRKADYSLAGWYTNQACTGDAVTQISVGTVGDVTVYAKWTPVEYTVTYVTNGGSTVAPVTFTVETPTFDLISGCVRDGYAFGGWYTDEALVNPISQIVLGSSGDKTVYAKWGPNNIAVTVNLDGVASVGDHVVTVTDSSAHSMTLSKESNGIFRAYTSESLPIVNEQTYSVTVDGTPVGDVTVSDGMAARTVNFWTFSFSSTGGSPVADIIVLDGRSVTEPAAPTKLGHTFTGWFTAAVDGEAYDFESPVLVTTNVVATWEPVVMNVTFSNNYGEAGNFATATQTYGQPYAVSGTPVRADYEFIGWFTAAIGGTEVTIGTTVVTAVEAHTLYAHWRGAEVVVTFDANNGSIPQIPVTTLCYIGDTYVLAATPSKYGNTFAGWFTQREGGTEVTAETQVTDSNAHTLYAHWNVILHPVTIDLNGGTVSEIPTGWVEGVTPGTYVKSFAHGTFDYEVYGEFSNPVKPYFDIRSWQGNQQSALVEDDNLVLTAMYQKRTYNVRFDSNGGTGTESGLYAALGDTVDFLKPVSIYKEGKLFAGWNTAADGSGIAAGRNYVVPEDFLDLNVDGVITLYAQWVDGYYTAHVGDRFVGTAVAKQSQSGTPIVMNTVLVVVKADAEHYTVQIMTQYPGLSEPVPEGLEEFDQGHWPSLITIEEANITSRTPSEVVSVDFTKNGVAGRQSVTQYTFNLGGVENIVRYDDEEFCIYYKQEGTVMGMYIYSEITLTGFSSAVYSHYDNDSHSITYQSEIGNTSGQVTRSQSHYSDLNDIGFAAPSGMRFAGWYYVSPVDIDEFIALKNSNYSAYYESITSDGILFDPSIATMSDITVFAVWRVITIENTNINWTLTNMPSAFTMTLDGENALDVSGEVGDRIVFDGGSDWYYDNAAHEFTFRYGGEIWFAKVRDTAGCSAELVDGKLNVVLNSKSGLGKFDVNVNFYQAQPDYMGYAPSIGDSFTYANVVGSQGTYRVTGFGEFGNYEYLRPGDDPDYPMTEYIGYYPESFNGIPSTAVVTEGSWDFNGSSVRCYVVTNTVFRQYSGVSETTTERTYVGIADGLVYSSPGHYLVSKTVSKAALPLVTVNFHVDEHSYIRAGMYNDGDYGQNVTYKLYALDTIQAIGGGIYSVTGLALTPGGSIVYTLNEDDLVVDGAIDMANVRDGVLDLYVITYAPGATVTVSGNGGVNGAGLSNASFFQVYNRNSSAASTATLYPDQFGFTKNGHAAVGFSITGVDGVKKTLEIQAVDGSDFSLYDMYVSHGYGTRVATGVYMQSMMGMEKLIIGAGYSVSIGLVYGDSATVTYDPNGGVGARVNDLVPAEEGTFVFIENCTFTKTNSKFLGWGLSADATEFFEAGSIISSLRENFVDGAVTLYALWAPCFTAEFQYSDEVFQDHLGPMQMFCDGVTANVLPTLRFNNGYDSGRFLVGWKVLTESGWTLYPVDRSLSYTFSEDLVGQTLVFHAVVHDYNEQDDDPVRISFNNGGSAYGISVNGSMSGFMDVEPGITFQLPKSVYTCTTARFIGWNTAANGSGTAYADCAVLNGITGDLTLYAQWEVAKEVMLFADEDHHLSTTYVYADSVELPSTIDFYGFALLGWTVYGDDRVYEPGSVVAIGEGNRIIFIAQLGVTVNFLKNHEGANITGSMDSIVVPYGDYYELPAVPFTDSSNTEFACGWSFESDAGWYDVYHPGDEVGFDGGVANLYVIWDKCTTVHFDAGEGSGTMADMHFAMNIGAEAPECTFTAPAGKVFRCWLWTDIDESEWEYYPEGWLEFGLYEVTLVAQWEEDW